MPVSCGSSKRTRAGVGGAWRISSACGANASSRSRGSGGRRRRTIAAATKQKATQPPRKRRSRVDGGDDLFHGRRQGVQRNLREARVAEHALVLAERIGVAALGHAKHHERERGRRRWRDPVVVRNEVENRDTSAA